MSDVQTVQSEHSGIEGQCPLHGLKCSCSKFDKATFGLLDFYFGQGGALIDTASFYAKLLPGCRVAKANPVMGE